MAPEPVNILYSVPVSHSPDERSIWKTGCWSVTLPDWLKASIDAVVPRARRRTMPPEVTVSAPVSDRLLTALPVGLPAPMMPPLSTFTAATLPVPQSRAPDLTVMRPVVVSPAVRLAWMLPSWMLMGQVLAPVRVNEPWPYLLSVAAELKNPANAEALSL